MSARDELAQKVKSFLDKNYPCCGVAGCSGEEEEAHAIVDIVEAAGYALPDDSAALVSARDELVKEIRFAVSKTLGFIAWTDQAPVDLAYAIRLFGYRKLRMVRTAAQLDSLPDDSVVLAETDGPLTKMGDWWHMPSGEMRSENVILPATVLYEGVSK